MSKNLSTKESLKLLRISFLILIPLISLCSYFYEYYVYNYIGTIFKIRFFSFSYIAFGFFIQSIALLLKLYKKNQLTENGIFLNLIVYSFLAVNYNMIYIEPSNLPVQAKNYHKKQSEEFQKTLDKKIVNRMNSFEGKYTLNNYINLLPIIESVNHLVPVGPSHIENINIMDYILKFESQEDCEKSLIKKISDKFNECTLYKGS